MSKHIEATALTDLQPLNNAFLPGGVKFEQQPFIGSQLLPEVSASPDGTLKATYFTFGKEAFLNAADEVGLYGDHTRADLGLTQTNVTLVKHGRSAWIDPDERSAAAAIGQNIDDLKAAVAKGQVEVRKEALAAALLTATGSYASASHYETLSGTAQWSHASSDPLGAINAKIEYLRSVNGAPPNKLWMDAGVASALRLNANVVKYVSGGATRQNPAVPISLEMLGSILGIQVLVGGSVASTIPGGTVSDVWGDCAGLLYVGGPGMYDLKFGETLISSGYPIQRVERDPHKGSKGIDIVYYDDAYKHVVTLNTAGYLWSDVTA